jgi:biopolymer transport protein ExbB
MSKRVFLFCLVLCLSAFTPVFLDSSRAQEAVPPDAADAPETSGEASVAAAAPDAGAPAGELETSWLTRMRRSGMVDFYIRGGFFMHPILLCSILGLAVILERAYVLSRARTDAKKLVAEMLHALKSGGPEAARGLLEKTRGPIAAILHAGLLRADVGLEAVERSILTAAAIEVSFLERGLIWLASIANIAPLLGFLGTVSGMIHAFEAIAAAEQVSPKLVADGIAEALITTAAGLIVAIPVQVAYNYFVQRIERYSVDMEESSHDLLDALTQSAVKARGQATS